MNMTWSVDQFYWAVLDASVLPRSSRRSAEQLGYLFESRLPVTIDCLQAAYVHLADDQVLATGVPSDVLAGARLDEVLSLTPDHLPAWIDERVRAQAAPDQLNMLTGAWTPASIRRGQRRLAICTAGAIVACAVLISAGFERRRADVTAATLDAHDEAMVVYATVLGASIDASIGTSFPPEQRLVAEHRRLTQTRTVPVASKADRIDAAALLTAIIERWPTDQFVETETITVASGAIVLVLRTPSLEDVQPLADSFTDLAGWRLTQPQTVTRADRVHVTLRFTRAEATS